MNRRATSRDANHAPIVSELRQRGICVLELDRSGNGVTDIVTHHRGSTVFIELKYGKTAVLKKSQAEFLSMWTGHCGIATDTERAYLLATQPIAYALTQKQKDTLAGHALTMGKQTRIGVIMRLLK